VLLIDKNIKVGTVLHLLHKCLGTFTLLYHLLCIPRTKRMKGTHCGPVTSVRPSVARLNSRTTGWIRMKFGMGVVPRGIAPNRSAEYSKIGSNKTADDESCEVGPTGGALWWPKSEACPKIKQWLGVYHGYHVNRGKQCYSLYYWWHGKPAALVAKVGTMSQAKTVAGITL
jgi:hypothetical protein